jgi:hypothetical protein
MKHKPISSVYNFAGGGWPLQVGFIFFIRILETQGDERIGFTKKGNHLTPNSSP